MKTVRWEQTTLGNFVVLHSFIRPFSSMSDCGSAHSQEREAVLDYWIEVGGFFGGNRHD